MGKVGQEHFPAGEGSLRSAVLWLPALALAACCVSRRQKARTDVSQTSAEVSRLGSCIAGSLSRRNLAEVRWGKQHPEKGYVNSLFI